MLNIKKCIASLLVLASLLGSLSVCAKASDEAQLLDLAALLISDGNFMRAKNLLDEIDIKNDDVDVAHFYLLSGLLAYKNGDFKRATSDYQASLQNGQEDKLIYIYLAQTHYAQENYQQAITAIDLSGDKGIELSSVYSLKAQCYWKLNKLDDAWVALESGRIGFPGDNRFDRQKMYYLIELGLYQGAIDLALPFLQTASAEQEYIALGRALRGSGQNNLAIKMLEKAKLLYPLSTPVITELAHAYIKKDQFITASDLFSQAYIQQPKLAADTSELLRQAGRLYRALNINSEIIDQKAKLKQRLAILVELQDFESVAAMDEALNRLGLYENEDIRYAHAYALFRTGDFTQSKIQLSQLKRKDLFRKASELRQAMVKCQGSAWQCY